MQVVRYKNRHWAVYDESGALVVVAVYKRGAHEVKRRLSSSSQEAEGNSSASSLLVLERKVEHHGY